MNTELENKALEWLKIQMGDQTPFTIDDVEVLEYNGVFGRRITFYMSESLDFNDDILFMNSEMVDQLESGKNIKRIKNTLKYNKPKMKNILLRKWLHPKRFITKTII